MRGDPRDCPDDMRTCDDGKQKVCPYGKIVICMKKQLVTVILLLFSSSACLAGDFLSISGRLDLLGVVALESDSIMEDPSFTGRLKIDTPPSKWSLHSWLEGGWDGSVKLPAKDHSLLKLYDEVYQSNTPWLEFKEFYLSFSAKDLELRAGVQRYSWGRLDEYPINDLLNPWDYTRFILRTLEDRKIGAPSLSANLNKDNWSLDAVWIPRFVPYRLAMPDERWSGVPGISALLHIPNAEVIPDEPNLPSRTFNNGVFGLRVRHAGEIEWALNFFHGYDPRPVVKTTSLVINPQPGKVLVDAGYVPDFHKMTSIGMDAAAVKGDCSLRAETAYSFNRWFNTRQELWGYPPSPGPGVFPLNPNEHKSDTLDYGVAADYRIIEDVLLTMQAQQTVVIHRPDTLYVRQFETLLWANLKVFWMNQKVETNLNLAYNPEHGDGMAKANAWYIFTDSWKAGLMMVVFTGPPQSMFGRFSKNDQVEAELVYSW
ncbi:MAG: uncharacterized protein H6Q57_659 [Geobacteraceae bacterium]|nr:uncharacterized protein [Geobacteraceae bacterium]